jgi:hypothetical protein
MGAEYSGQFAPMRHNVLSTLLVTTIKIDGILSVI